MVTMKQIDEIKRLRDDEKLSFRHISERINMDRRTVKKWYYSKQFPEYKRKKIISPVKDKIIHYLKQWVNEDIQLIQQKKKKKISNSFYIHNRLMNMGIKVSPSTVRKYLFQIRPKDVYIPLEYDPGIDMQVDWGIMNITFNKEQTIKVYLFVATLPYSNTRFLYPYIKADYISFFDGHIKAFDFFYGIPKRITYDNLSSAVKRVLLGYKREEQDKMIYFKTFYDIETNYCNVGKGNEKGSVENAVGYFKRYIDNSCNYLKDFDELRKISYEYSSKLLERKHYKNSSKTIFELLSEEQKYFRKLPEYHIDISNIKIVKCSSTSMISYDGVKYSIPCSYASKELLLKATAEEIIIYSSKVEQQEICRHKRENKLLTKEVSDFRHYLDALLEKPRALSYAKCIKSANFPTFFNEYLSGLNIHQKKGNRQMVKILSLVKDFNIKDIFFAMEYCLNNKTFSYDAVKLTLNEINKEKKSIEKINKHYPETMDIVIDNTKYDKLLGGF